MIHSGAKVIVLSPGELGARAGFIALSVGVYPGGQAVRERGDKTKMHHTHLGYGGVREEGEGGEGVDGDAVPSTSRAEVDPGMLPVVAMARITNDVVVGGVVAEEVSAQPDTSKGVELRPIAPFANQQEAMMEVQSDSDEYTVTTRSMVRSRSKGRKRTGSVRGKRETSSSVCSTRRMTSSDSSRRGSSAGSRTTAHRVRDAGAEFFAGSGDEFRLPPEKIGGKITTAGAYVGLRNVQREVAEARSELQEMRELKSILHPDSELSVSLKQKLRKKTEEYVEKVEHETTPDIAARALETVKKVLKVSTSSRGLKGDLQCSLRDSAAQVNAYVHLLSRRAQLPPDTRAIEEVKALREELGVSRAQVEELKKQVEMLRGVVARGLHQPHDRDDSSPEPRRKSARKRKKTRAEGEETEERDMGGEENGGETIPTPPPYSDSEEPPKVVLPPQEEWPAVMRPEVGGSRKVILEKGEADFPLHPPNSCGEKHNPPPARREEEAPPKDLGELFEKLKSHMEELFKERLRGKKPRKEKEGNLPPPLPLSRGTVSGGTGGERGKAKGKGGKGKTGQGKAVERGSGAPKVTPPPTATRAAQIADQRPPKAQEETWATVARRGRVAREKTAEQKKGPNTAKAGPSKGSAAKGQDQPSRGSAGKKNRRTPNSAAVVITCPKGKYEEVTREARSKVDLASLKIESLRPKRAITGAIIYEVAGEGGAAKAEGLALKLREVFAGREEIRVARPIKTMEIRVSNLDDAAVKEEIAEAVASAGGGVPAEVRVGELRKAPNGLTSAWVRCPLVVAKKVTTKGKIRIGWITARAEALEERPLRCFRCLRRGHVRAMCQSEIDRSDLCYRCGGKGHVAQLCGAQPRCILCAEAGLPHGHRVGAKSCKAPTREKKVEGQGKPAPKKKGEKGNTPPDKEEKMEVEGECPDPPSTTSKGRAPSKMEVDPPPKEKKQPGKQTPRVTDVQNLNVRVTLERVDPREGGAGK